MQRGARSTAVPTAGIFRAARTSMNRADVRRRPTCRSFLKTGIRATHTAMNLRPAHNPYKWTRHSIARWEIGAADAQIQFWKIIRRLNVAIEVPMNAADIGNIAAKPAKPPATEAHS